MSITVTYTGTRAGSEVVQIYRRDLTGVVLRPERELAGFAKVHLEVGGSRRVDVEVPARSFEFWDVRTDEWRCPTGRFELVAARSSADHGLTLSLQVDGDATDSADPPSGPALAASDVDFAARLGRSIPAPRPTRPFDRDSTFAEIATTPAGRAFRAICWHATIAGTELSDADRPMVERNFAELPLPRRHASATANSVGGRSTSSCAFATSVDADRFVVSRRPLRPSSVGLSEGSTMGISWTLFVVLGLVIGLGAFVQRVAGFGLAVVAAPFVVMAAPDLMPASLLITVLPLPLLEAVRGRAHVLWRSCSWALLGRLATMPLGVWLVSVASTSVISLVVAAMVLAAVAGSFTRIHVQPTPALSGLAGLVTGVSATAASIGGPFYGLVLQEQKPQQVRSTLAPFFLIGALASLAGLGVGGQVPREALIAGVAWMPFMVLGSVLAQPLRHRIDPTRFKQLMLMLATVAAVAVIVRVALTV